MSAGHGPRAVAARLLTVGHGVATGDQLAAVLHRAGVELVVDVRARPGSRRHPQVRREAMASWLLADAAARPTAALCAESAWWRCHRRLLSDAAVIVRGAEVVHLDHRGGLQPHLPTGAARRDGDLLAYDQGEKLLPGL